MNGHITIALVPVLFIALPCLANNIERQDRLQNYLQQTTLSYQQQLPKSSSASINKGNAVNQWIDSSEIRLSSENDDDSSRSVALNIKIKNRSQVNIQKKLFDLLVQNDELKQQQNLNSYLHRVYSQIIELNYKLEHLHHLKMQSSLATLEIKYQRELAQSNDFDPENLLESELDLERIQLQIELIQQGVADLTETLNLTFNQSFLHLSPAQIIARIKQYSLQSSLEITQDHQNVELAKLNLKQQQSGEGFALNALQVKSDFSDDKDTVLGIRFDIQIPFAGPSYNKQLKQQEITQALKRLHLRKQQSRINAELSLKSIESMNKEFGVVSQQAQRLDKRIANTSNVQLILKLKKLHLNRLEKLITIKHNIRSSYIDFLAQRGLLASHSNNWLAENLTSGRE